MKESTSTVTSKGQVTIPKAIREELGVGPGDRVVFIRGSDGKIVVEPQTVDVRSLRGVIEPKRRGVTIEQMNEAIRKAGTRK
jgi:AbrB family looped-hinge helix DNA binding protein